MKLKAAHHFKRDHGHVIYVEEYGNLRGTPILVLHGGPGYPLPDRPSEFLPSFCNAKTQRIIYLHQRGSGKSRPLGSLRANTLDYSIQDIETIRQKLKIEAWHVFGYSWGSLLALNYGAQFPTYVRSLILGGMFTGRDKLRDSDILFNTLYPDQPHWRHERPPDAYQDNHQRLLNHYESHNWWMTRGKLKKLVKKLESMPVTIIQGRFDDNTPMTMAYDVYAQLLQTRSTASQTMLRLCVAPYGTHQRSRKQGHTGDLLNKILRKVK